jgi:hypothetical protein
VEFCSQQVLPSRWVFSFSRTERCRAKCWPVGSHLAKRHALPIGTAEDPLEAQLAAIDAKKAIATKSASPSDRAAPAMPAVPAPLPADGTPAPQQGAAADVVAATPGTEANQDEDRRGREDALLAQANKVKVWESRPICRGPTPFYVIAALHCCLGMGLATRLCSSKGLGAWMCSMSTSWWIQWMCILEGPACIFVDG